MGVDDYNELIKAFESMEKIAPRPKCLDVAPQPDQMIPNIKVYLWSSRTSNLVDPHCRVANKDCFCNIGYKYQGFESRRVKFEVKSAYKKTVFGATKSHVWGEKEVWLLLPRKSLGEDYFVTRLNKTVCPAGPSVAGDEDSLIGQIEVPESAGTLVLQMGINVTSEV